MTNKTYKFLAVSALLVLPIFIWFFWRSFFVPETLESLTKNSQKAGEAVVNDLQTLPAMPLTEEKDNFVLTDNTSDGIDIQFANQNEETLKSEDKKEKLSFTFPKDYGKPLEVKLDKERTITIQDLGGNQDYTANVVSGFPSAVSDASSVIPVKTGIHDDIFSWFKRLDSRRMFIRQLEDGNDKEEGGNDKSFLSYTSKDKRKTLLYSYQKDQATGEKKLKHWTIYKEGNGLETESYKIENAKIKIGEKGEAQVFFFGDQDFKNEQAKADVDSSLLERAQKTLAKEMGEDILSGNKTPDFVIPKPYFVDKDGNKTDSEWKWNEETKTLMLFLAVKKEQYPIALDPTLQFTAPSQSNTGNVITGETTSNNFGYSLTAGDFNSDGRTDLLAGAYSYSSVGRAYIFYNDGNITAAAASADVIITGESTGDFGAFSTSGDFNSDGRTDIAISSRTYSSNTGRAYIFYNDGSIPTTAATADVTITGGATSDNFGFSLISGDFNFDGRTDLTVGAFGYSTNTGRAYIFYNDGSIPTTAGTADVIITGGATSDNFSYRLTSGDFNSDGRTDLAVGAQGYSTNTGRAYIFYNDGSIPTTAGTADVIITGGATNDYFGYSLTDGDFNDDGKTDLVVGAYAYSSYTGRAYIFYNDGSIPTTAGTADVTITGGATSNSFGAFLTSGDFNADGKTDLAVGAYGYSTNTGRAYIFYNDGSIPTTAGTADITITGETTSNYFGPLTSGDFNSDGRIDLVVGAYQYSSSTGRVYLYTFNDSVITGETTSNYFGYALTSGDFNADGKTDLAVGAYGYSTSTGRAYIFYNDGSIPTTAATADVTITGGSTSDNFGASITAGDFNSDGKTDLAVGASGYSSSTGRAYIFYNDGSIPTTAGTADVTITGGATNDQFSNTLTSGDFNVDGRTDLAVGAAGYSTNTGRAYIFYNDGSIPTTAGTADVTITGETTNDYFGIMLISDDLNSDGRTDLIVGSYDSSFGHVYIFYNDGSYPTTAITADVIITGEASADRFGASMVSGDFNSDGKADLAVGSRDYSTSTGRTYIFYSQNGQVNTNRDITGGATSDYFGFYLTSGDFNADGRIDLAVGANGYSTNTGRVYIFYNDGSIPTTAASADVIITGGATSDKFGTSLISGDFNADGRIDLTVGAQGYSTNTGRAYIFYNDGSIPTTAATADVTITGGANNDFFGFSLTSGDFNADGRIDLTVGAQGYSTNTGRAYIFYNDGSIPTTAATADVTITGGANSDNFGYSLVSGDFNADSRTDLAAGAYGYSTNTGRAYIFYNDGSIPTTAGTADVAITGETTSNFFSVALAVGDFNADGKTDLAVGAYGYSSYTGRVYIFYNDGSIPTTAGTADVTITGEATSNFGSSFISGDFNSDGKTDLAVGAYGYSSSTGRAYIFYNDSSIPTTAATADVTITGETTSNNFGYSLTSGDFNADGKTDLTVGAYGYSSSTGRAYIFITEAATTPLDATTFQGNASFTGSVKFH